MNIFFVFTKQRDNSRLWMILRLYWHWDWRRNQDCHCHCDCDHLDIVKRIELSSPTEVNNVSFDDIYLQYTYSLLQQWIVNIYLRLRFYVVLQLYNFEHFFYQDMMYWMREYAIHMWHKGLVWEIVVISICNRFKNFS